MANEMRFAVFNDVQSYSFFSNKPIKITHINP